MLSRLPDLAIFALSVICGAAGFVSAAEPVSLFDGETLDGWKVIGCEAVVRDGAILLKSGNGLVEANKRYRDFVLEYEWKALNPEMWDSGVYFRYDAVPSGQPWPSRYQVNLRKGMEGNIDGFDNGKNTVKTKPGEWNRFELTVKGSTASLKVNGEASWTVDGITTPEGRLAIQAEVPGGGQFLCSLRYLSLKSTASGFSGAHPPAIAANEQADHQHPQADPTPGGFPPRWGHSDRDRGSFLIPYPIVVGADDPKDISEGPAQRDLCRGRVGRCICRGRQRGSLSTSWVSGT